MHFSKYIKTDNIAVVRETTKFSGYGAKMVETTGLKLVTRVFMPNFYVKYTKKSLALEGFDRICMPIVATICDTARCNILNCNLLLYSYDVKKNYNSVITALY